jgi:hypothetical protein
MARELLDGPLLNDRCNRQGVEPEKQDDGVGDDYEKMFLLAVLGVVFTGLTGYVFYRVTR